MNKKLLFLFVILSLYSCSTAFKLIMDADSDIQEQLENISYPEMRFLVISDTHLFDSSLMDSTSDSFLESNSKMFRESKRIINAFIEQIENIQADFVLVCGDLTKDGEKISHESMAGLLNEIENNGKKVFVVPGNHDVLNNRAVSYLNDAKERVDTVAPEDFKTIYNDFGYKEAVMSDSDSLSYVTEPVEGLWLLGIDSCRYRENESRPLSGGNIYPETLLWIIEVLKRAIIEGKAVISFMHHGILEHFPGQSRYYENYIVNDYSKISKLFALYGMKLVFTGHFHAQDIVAKTWDDNSFLIDIETGSFVSYPIPYRIVDINEEQIMKITSNFITIIDRFKTGFSEYAYERRYNDSYDTVYSVVSDFRISEEDAIYISEIFADASMAHFAGDENIDGDIIDYKRIGIWAGFIIDRRKNLLEGIWNDPFPEDNNIIIDLKDIDP